MRLALIEDKIDLTVEPDIMQGARLARERMAVPRDNLIRKFCSDKSAESNPVCALRSPPQTRIIQTFASFGWSKLWKRVSVQVGADYEEGSHGPVSPCDCISH